MAGKWLNSSSERLADFYSQVRDDHALFGSFAGDDATQEDLLTTCAELERRVSPTPEIVEADKLVVAEGLHESYDYGPEWPFHLHEIRAGTFDPQRLPEHLRERVAD